MTAARKLRRRLSQLGPGVHVLQVLHDADCSQVVTGKCACSPDYEVEPMTPTTFERAATKTRAWQRERLS